MNSRFSDYATSGAFTLTLTRNQVSELAMLDSVGLGYLSGPMASLERKGLAEPVSHPTPDNPEAVEFRPTLAGLLVQGLCREAGLTNGPENPVAAELAALRAEVERRRHQAAEAVLVARSALARREADALDAENTRRLAAGEKMLIRVRTRDPLEGVSDDELRQRVPMHWEFP